MNRTKPPFRADHVGSLLRPASLHEARAKRASDEIGADALKAIEDREIERIIKKQEEMGLHAITDGEFRRSWWHLDFLWGLDGAEKHIMDAGVKFAAVNTRNEGVQVTGKLGMAGPHPMVEHFKFVAAHTQRTPKITIPAPSAIYGRPMMTPIDKQVYPGMDAFFSDLGQAYKKAVRGFADAGCRYLQLAKHARLAHFAEWRCPCAIAGRTAVAAPAALSAPAAICKDRAGPQPDTTGRTAGRCAH